MQIVRVPSKALLIVAKPLPLPPSSEALGRVLEMLDLMLVEGGIGLAAPQVGWDARVFVTNIDQSIFSEVVYFNPEITWSSNEEEVAEEGCLSIPGVAADVRRPVAISLRAHVLFGTTLRRLQNRLGSISPQAAEVSLRSLPARCAQHEIDHLNGMLFTERAKRSSGA